MLYHLGITYYITHRISYILNVWYVCVCVYVWLPSGTQMHLECILVSAFNANLHKTFNAGCRIYRHNRVIVDFYMNLFRNEFYLHYGNFCITKSAFLIPKNVFRIHWKRCIPNTKVWILNKFNWLAFIFYIMNSEIHSIYIWCFEFIIKKLIYSPVNQTALFTLLRAF